MRRESSFGSSKAAPSLIGVVPISAPWPAMTVDCSDMVMYGRMPNGVSYATLAVHDSPLTLSDAAKSIHEPSVQKLFELANSSSSGAERSSVA